MDRVPSTPKRNARRKNPSERRAEMIEAASEIAIHEGLEKVTARRVAAKLGVFPGLVDHYFSADQLVAAAFAHAAAAEREELYDAAYSAGGHLAGLRYIITELMRPEVSDVGLLWLDAWQAVRHRPALRDEVAGQMHEDVRRLGQLIRLCAEDGQVRAAAPEAAAVQVLSLIDGLSVQGVMRDKFDYTDVQDLVTRVVEQILGISLAGE
jgi:DNA-binding transcriptional regulator YbjK